MRTKKIGFLSTFDGSSDSVATASESETDDGSSGNDSRRRRFRRKSSSVGRQDSRKVGSEAKFYLFNDSILIVSGDSLADDSGG